MTEDVRARIAAGDPDGSAPAPRSTVTQPSAARPAGNFEQFENAMLRNVAAGTGLATQQVSQNWSDVNYSSYRAAMLEAWKTLGRRRTRFGIGFGTLVQNVWRPVLGTAVMAAALWTTGMGWGVAVAGSGLSQVSAAVALGVPVFAGVLLGAWLAAGRPAGAEADVLVLIRQWTKR